jgi:hypothetical protein
MENMGFERQAGINKAGIDHDIKETERRADTPPRAFRKTSQNKPSTSAKLS